jgi:aquaglyceroporin related protein
MVPATDEIEQEAEEQREALAAEDAQRADLEAGRIEPTLRPDKIASQIDSIGRERELSLFRAYQQQYQESPGLSPLGRRRRTSETPTETPRMRLHPDDVIDEEPGGQEEPPDLDLPESIAGVKQAREEEDLRAPYHDVIPLPAYQAEDDEVHNLHTYWSVLRLRFREPLAELLAVRISLSSQQRPI